MGCWDRSIILTWSSSPGGLNTPDVAAWIQQGLFKAVITQQVFNLVSHICLQAERDAEIREGQEWMEEERGVCCAIQSLEFPSSTQSWASPEIPLLTFSVCTAGFGARSCSTYIQNKYYPCPSSPWYSLCAASAACSPCLKSCRMLEPPWEKWPWNTPWSRPATRTLGMGAGRHLQPGCGCWERFQCAGRNSEVWQGCLCAAHYTPLADF